MPALIPMLAPYRAYIVEFIGTFFLVLTVGLNVLTSPETKIMNPVAIGSILMVMIYMGGHISGAHYNPSVTLGVYLRGGNKISLKETIAYIVMQVFAAFVAALIVFAATETTFAPTPGPGYGIVTTLFVEFFFTFALVLVVLSVATSQALEGNSFYGLAIGFTVTAGAYTGGGISGGAFNPALVTGSMIVDILSGPEYKIQYIWVYLLASITGSFAAAFIFRILNYKEYEDDLTSNV